MTVTSLAESGLLTVAESAAHARVSGRTIRRLIAKGDLPARRIGRCVRILRSDLERWERALPLFLETSQSEAS